MRVGGVIVSIVGHVGAVMMTMLAWETATVELAPPSTTVPVEIVAIAEESNVRALTETVEEAEPLPSEQTVPEEAPAPTPTPTPPRERQRPQPQEEFDLASIARMVDKQRDAGRERNDGAQADRTQRGAGLGTAEVASMRDRIQALSRAHISRNNCWRMPVDLPEPERLIITVEFELDRNGALRGQPRVTRPANPNFDPAMRTAAEQALRAVRMCDPFPFADDPIVGPHYELWREMEYTFRPRL